MRISVFGMGYVGSVTSACLAQMGHNVFAVEPNPTKLSLIRQGRSPVIENGLDDLVAKAAAAGKLTATADWRCAVAQTELAVICVGTPSRSNGRVDLAAVTRVCEQIGDALANKSDYFTVVVRSTVPPGTVEETLIPTLQTHSKQRVGVDFGVCMNPEFLREGTAIDDFRNPPKTVIGEYDRRSGDLLVPIYKDLQCHLIRTTLRIAEMIKYADNSFHALKISFANEIGSICKAVGIDSHTVMDLLCSDVKLNLSPTYLKPGFAFGGSCLPKDLRAINYEAKLRDVELPLLSAILESNKKQILKVINKLLSYKGRSLGFLGLSFKHGTDDLRESPIVEVIESMIGKGFRVRVYDRHVSIARLLGTNKEYIEQEIPHISELLCASLEDLMATSEVIVIANRDVEFIQALKDARADQVIIDLIRLIEPETALDAEYYGISW